MAVIIATTHHAGHAPRARFPAPDHPTIGSATAAEPEAEPESESESETETASEPEAEPEPSRLYSRHR